MPPDHRPPQRASRGSGKRLQSSSSIHVDVEPLNDARWAKIEGALFDQLERDEHAAREVHDESEHDERVATSHIVEGPAYAWWRTGAYFVVAGAVAAAIGAIVSRAVWHPEPPPAISSHVETGTSGTHLVIGEAALDVGPQAALFVNGDDAHGVLVVLERGKVDFEVTPRRERPPFVVQAGEARVRVTGTRFSVDRTGEGARVDVSSGMVEVSAHGQMANVHAGEHWPAKDTAQPLAVPEPAAVLDPAPASTAAEVPRASRKASGSPRPESATPPPPVVESAEPEVPSSSNESDTSSLFSPAEPSDAMSRRMVYESAARLESTRPMMSLAQYAELARGSDPWAANALYAAGRLQADRGMKEHACRTLEDYLVRFPRGPNAADARDLLGRLKGKTRVP
ncbi:FecR domain-containing protein [Pendulispora albinea]|uniref:FecR domain-containing protein n=1 Tax=Pendulispora albinea TaxID=2741071 RepID=A0ABZ2MAI5_9BACT